MNKNAKEFDKYARWGVIHRGCGGYLNGKTDTKDALRCSTCGTEIRRNGTTMDDLRDVMSQIQVVVMGERVCCPQCGQWGKLLLLPDSVPADYSAIVLHDDDDARRVCKITRI